MQLSQSHGIVSAAIDCDGGAQELCSRLRIEAYPHVVFHPPPPSGKQTSLRGVQFDDFDRRADSLVRFAIRGWQPSKVVRLTTAAFRETVDPRTRGKRAGGFAPHVVLFTAGHWCGPCVQMESTVKDLAAQLAADPTRKATVVARVDCDRHRDTCSSAGVGGYPHLTFVPAAAHPQTAWQDSSMHFPQNAPRDADRLYTWAAGLFDATQAPLVSSVADLEKMRVKQLKKLVMQHGLGAFPGFEPAPRVPPEP